MKTIQMLIELTYDAEIMHGDDEESRNWFYDEVLYKDQLLLHSNEIGDTIGTVKVLTRTTN